MAAAEAGHGARRRLCFGVGTPVGEVVGEEVGGQVLVRFDRRRRGLDAAREEGAP